MQLRRSETESSLTLRWRKVDSNLRSPCYGEPSGAREVAHAAGREGSMHCSVVVLCGAIEAALQVDVADRRLLSSAKPNTS